MRQLQGMHLIFPGFTQGYDRVNGSEILCREMISVVPEHHGVFFFTWDVDPRAIAKFVNRMCSDVARVCFYCYSWGGDTGVDCCAELKTMGREVEAFVACDIVYRTSWLPTWLPLNILSMTKLPTIVMPSNVVEVWQFRQKNNRPRGHNIVHEKGHNVPVIHAPVLLDRTHEWMDDAPEYQEKALAVASTHA